MQVAARGERVGVGIRRVKVARPVSVMHCSIGTRDALRRASGVTGRGGRREGSMRRLRLEARMGLEAQAGPLACRRVVAQIRVTRVSL